MHSEPSRPALSKDGPLPDRGKAAAGAKALMVLLAFAWGFNWIAAAIALKDVPPWSLRFVGTGLGALTLAVAVVLSGRSLWLSCRLFMHVSVAGLLNVALFNMAGAFAQLNGATSRVIIVTYSMPIWATAGAWLLLGDKLDKVRLLALALCIGGLGILVWPLFAVGVPVSVFYALGCALGWAGATVYWKWVKADIDPLVNATWQLTVGTAVIAIGMLIVDGYPQVWPISTESLLALVYIGLFGVGLAHFLWWAIVGKLPTITASIGSLLVPVVGVIGSAVVRGERPTITDMIGFASIFLAAACVLLQPAIKRDEMPE